MIFQITFCWVLIRLFAYLVDVLCIGAITGITLDTIYHLGGWSSSGHPFDSTSYSRWPST